MADRSLPPIDEDIRRAATMPSRFYSDAALFERSREAIFAKSWQLVADASRVKVPGQVYPFTLLEGMIDEPLVLTRDRNDALHCLSNVCTHRGTLVCEGAGVEQGLRCRYHGRRFGLDGKFQFMPEFEGAEGFPSSRDDLPTLPLESWGPFLFTSLAAGAPFAELVREMNERCGHLPLNEATFDPTRAREYVVNAHWALYVENYLEGFHIPYVHAGLAGALDYGEYRTELYPWSNLQLGVAKLQRLQLDVAREEDAQEVGVIDAKRFDREERSRFQRQGRSRITARFTRGWWDRSWCSRTGSRSPTSSPVSIKRLSASGSRLRMCGCCG